MIINATQSNSCNAHNRTDFTPTFALNNVLYIYGKSAAQTKTPTPVFIFQAHNLVYWFKNTRAAVRRAHLKQATVAAR